MKKLLLIALLFAGCAEQNTYKGEEAHDDHIYNVEKGKTWDMSSYTRYYHSPLCPNPIHKDTIK